MGLVPIIPSHGRDVIIGLAWINFEFRDLFGRGSEGSEGGSLQGSKEGDSVVAAESGTEPVSEADMLEAVEKGEADLVAEAIQHMKAKPAKA
jgi:hypothetical protein